MTKTQYIRQYVAGKLAETEGGVYHRRAPDDAAYPYKVYRIERVNLDDRTLDLAELVVDVYDRSPSPVTCESLADEVEALFAYVTEPQEHILPTVWREARDTVESEDKELQRIRLRFAIHLYEKDAASDEAGNEEE